MNKLLIEIPVLLPEIESEKDQCVDRLTALLNDKSGIEKVHVKEEDNAELCIHYVPEIISLEQVKNIAELSGAELSNRFQHLLLEVKGIRHQRHARTIEQSLQQVPGILEAITAATGIIRLEWDTEQINKQQVYQA